jgi:MtN3 and saliva related transmembrane protein
LGTGNHAESTGLKNMKEYSLYVGIGAGICSALSLLPQLLKIIQEKKANDISFLMLFILLTGLAGWIGYGILKSDYPIIITNGFSFCTNLLIIFFSLKYKRRVR